LLSEDSREAFNKEILADYARLREEHASKSTEKKLVTLEEARTNRPSIDWSSYHPPKPEFIGTQIYTTDLVSETSSRDRSRRAITLEDLVPYIDWSPFFHTWELRGRYPAIFDDPVVGKQARELFDDAQKLLQRICAGKRLIARGVYAFWPAGAIGDDIEVYTDETRAKQLATFHFLRQQMKKPSGQFNHCLADYVAPKNSQPPSSNSQPLDYLGGFAVTAGIGADELAQTFTSEHDDYSSILTKALADRLAEAFAEFLHHEARVAWGFGRDENLSNEELLREKYQGIRPAAGYPASPDHTEKRTLFKLLNAEQATGITLTESFAMHPGASVSGLYFSHPDSKYFGVGKIGNDQVQDYAARKKVSPEYVEKWLAPNLNN